MPLQVEPEKNMGKDERRFQSLPLGGRCSVSKKSAFYEAVRDMHRPCRGRCPHRPEKGCEFAVNFRKNSLFCRDDVGIVPYKQARRFSVKTGKNISRQSHTQSLTGTACFCLCRSRYRSTCQLLRSRSHATNGPTMWNSDRTPLPSTSICAICSTAAPVRM